MGRLTFLASRFSGQDRDSVHGMSGEHISSIRDSPFVEQVQQPLGYHTDRYDSLVVVAPVQQKENHESKKCAHLTSHERSPGLALRIEKPEM